MLLTDLGTEPSNLLLEHFYLLLLRFYKILDSNVILLEWHSQWICLPLLPRKTFDIAASFYIHSFCIGSSSCLFHDQNRSDEPKLHIKALPFCISMEKQSQITFCSYCSSGPRVREYSSNFINPTLSQIYRSVTGTRRDILGTSCSL